MLKEVGQDLSWNWKKGEQKKLNKVEKCSMKLDGIGKKLD